MKINELTPEQQEAKRKYDREAKQRQREKLKAERLRMMIPNADDYVMPEQHEKKLTEHCLGLTKSIAADLGVKKLTGADAYIVDGIASVLFGLENKVTQIVNDPFGMLVGGWFPDAAASEAIEYVHRFPDLLKSTTFAVMYDRFLQTVVNWSKKNGQYVSGEYIEEVEAEIAGEYVLPLPPKPLKPEPKREPEFPSNAEILERGRIKLLEQLSGHLAQFPDTRTRRNV